MHKQMGSDGTPHGGHWWPLPHGSNPGTREDWKYREAAVLAYGSIMEGPTSEKMRPMVEQSLSHLVMALQDPSVAVRDSDLKWNIYIYIWNMFCTEWMEDMKKADLTIFFGGSDFHKSIFDQI